MASAYERYLQRLYSQTNKRPELEMSNRMMRSLADPFQSMNRQLSRTLTADNASIGAKVMATMKGQNQLASMADKMNQQAVDQASMRTERLGADIAKAEMAVEQEKEQKRQKNTQILRSGLAAAGMAAGALLAIPTGGMSLVAGASIGGALGSAVGGFTGIDKGGNLSFDPEDWDMNATVEGLQQAGSVYASEMTANQLKEKSRIIANRSGAFYDALSKIKDKDTLIKMLDQLGFLLYGGTPQDLETFMLGTAYPNVQGGSPSYNWRP